MTILRFALGLFLLVMGSNKFLGFIPPMDMPPNAANFMVALMDTGYMLPMVGITEITCGALLLFASTAPFALVLLAPLSVNIILFHLFLAPESIWAAASVCLFNIILAAHYAEYYRSIFAKIFEEKVFYRNKSNADTGRLTATAN